MRLDEALSTLTTNRTLWDALLILHFRVIHERRGESRVTRMARTRTFPIKYEMRSYSPFTD